LSENIKQENKEDCQSGKTKVNNGYPCFIPAQRIMHLISRKWGIQLIYILKDGKRIRYNELRDILQKGWTKDRISDATLSARLAEFSEEGIMKREVFPELPPKVEYNLTKKGEKLAKALDPLINWTISVCHGHE